MYVFSFLNVPPKLLKIYQYHICNRIHAAIRFETSCVVWPMYILSHWLHSNWYTQPDWRPIGNCVFVFVKKLFTLHGGFGASVTLGQHSLIFHVIDSDIDGIYVSREYIFCSFSTR